MGKNKGLSAIDGFIRSAKKWQDEMAFMRDLLLDSGMTEAVKWRHPCYMYEDKNVAIIQDFKDYCAIMFIKGVLMDDPHGILVPVGESASQRQLRYKDLVTLKGQKEWIKHYINEAISLEIKGAVVESTKVDDLELPDELRLKFEEDSAYEEAFSRLTPGRQKAYIFHFNQAKKSETRTGRIEKAFPKILKGLGPNER